MLVTKDFFQKISKSFSNQLFCKHKQTAASRFNLFPLRTPTIITIFLRKTVWHCNKLSKVNGKIYLEYQVFLNNYHSSCEEFLKLDLKPTSHLLRSSTALSRWSMCQPCQENVLLLRPGSVKHKKNVNNTIQPVFFEVLIFWSLFHEP